LIVKLFYKHTINDHRFSFEYIKKCNMDYTIARPLSLTDGPEVGRYRESKEGVPKGGKEISRADVADFILKAVKDETYVKTSVGLAY
jgi:hypothetical protein